MIKKDLLFDVEVIDGTMKPVNKITGGRESVGRYCMYFTVLNVVDSF